MDKAVAVITEWTLTREIPVPADVMSVLIHGEQPYAAFATFRDSAIFTNKRLIVCDVQSMTGKKVEVYSRPWSSVLMWSSENAGTIGRDSEIELWTKAGHIKGMLHKGVDIRRLDSLISFFMLTQQH